MISGTNSENLINSEHSNCGPKRSLTPEHEFFLLLVRLRLGLLEEDLAYVKDLSYFWIKLYFLATKWAMLVSTPVYLVEQIILIIRRSWKSERERVEKTNWVNEFLIFGYKRSVAIVQSLVLSLSLNLVGLCYSGV